MKNAVVVQVLVVILLLTGGIFLIGYGQTGKHVQPPVHVTILAINDFHGHLYGGQQLNNRTAGSAPVLASHLNYAKQTTNASSVILALLGDTVGASPRNTSLLFDEPTILFFNSFAVTECTAGNNSHQNNCDLIAVPGNHEFNRGTDELLRMTYGGNGNITISRIADPYPGSLADTICANVVWKENNTPILPPYTIRTVEGVPVAFIGAVTLETPVLELPMNIERVEFLNESETINRYVTLLQGQGIHAFVVLLHEGGNQEPYEGPTRSGGNITGPVASIAASLNPDVDIVLSAHKHDFTNAYLKNSGGNDVLVTQAFAYGVAYADVDIWIDRKSGDIIEKSAVIVPVYANGADNGNTDPTTETLVKEIDAAVGRMDAEVIATTESPITRRSYLSGGSALGNLVADSQRAAMGADVAFVTTGSGAGSLHADISRGIITWKDLEAVLPSDASMAAEYGGWYSRPRVATRELTGDQIRKILERQWEEPEPAGELSVSGLEYTWDSTRPAGNRITTILVNGIPVDLNATYSGAMNYYMAYGMGDYAPVWKSGMNVTIGPADINALVTYIRSRPARWT
ncbi:MAG: bifunctional metallophosphatase/5'-nucleotidase [Methanoregula sp.]|nr:bifunctional metallophosphatase/5'-nucleotidase [Methanoregula sp.]